MQRNDYGVAQPALVKETSTPDVFLAYGDTKFHITSPDQMTALGLRWDAVEVVLDNSLDDLRRVELGAGPAVKPSQVFPVQTPNDYVPGEKPISSIVRNDILVSGFLTSEPNWNYPNGGQPFVEDVLYYLVLDVNFIDALYGPNGLSTALLDAHLPGYLNPGDNRIPPALPFGDLPADANGNRFATVGGFILPSRNETTDQVTPGGGLCFPTLHMELNCWHVTQELGTVRDISGVYRTEARGPAPAGWINVHEDKVVGPITIATTTFLPFLPVQWSGVVTDCWWPFNPNNPDGTGGDLKAYDNVLVCGTLFQDIAHDLNSAWDQKWAGDGGWLEIHPIDWMCRFQPPPATRTVHTIGLSTKTKYSDSGIMRPLPWNGTPVANQVPLGPPAEIIDSRFTGGPPDQVLSQHQYAISQTDGLPHIALQLKAVHSSSDPRSPQTIEYFKAAYRVDWSLPPRVPVNPVNPVNPECAQLAAQVSEAENMRANLQQQLRQAAAPEKPAIESQIAAVMKTLGQLQQRQTALGCPDASQ